MTPKARQRAEVIFKVRSGQMTATDAAATLGISRQQYYQWEARALRAILSAPTGRPKTPQDPEKEQLQHRVEQLEAQVQEQQQREHLRQIIQQWEQSPLPPSKKKNP